MRRAGDPGDSGSSKDGGAGHCFFKCKGMQGNGKRDRALWADVEGREEKEAGGREGVLREPVKRRGAPGDSWGQLRPAETLASPPSASPLTNVNSSPRPRTPGATPSRKPAVPGLARLPHRLLASHRPVVRRRRAGVGREPRVRGPGPSPAEPAPSPPQAGAPPTGLDSSGSGWQTRTGRSARDSEGGRADSRKGTRGRRT